MQPDAESRRINQLLQLEGLALALLGAVAYAEWGGSWWLFALLILAPDLAALGYLAGPRIGAWCYNAAHLYVGPAAMALLWVLNGSGLALGLALIWAIHISADRALGYGLKYPSNARQTHLGQKGRREQRAAQSDG